MWKWKNTVFKKQLKSKSCIGIFCRVLLFFHRSSCPVLLLLTFQSMIRPIRMAPHRIYPFTREGRDLCALGSVLFDLKQYSRWRSAWLRGCLMNYTLWDSYVVREGLHVHFMCMTFLPLVRMTFLHLLECAMSLGHHRMVRILHGGYHVTC